MSPRPPAWRSSRSGGYDHNRWLDLVETLGVCVGAAEAVKTVAAFAEVDGVAQGAGLEEVKFFEVDRRERVGKRGRVDRSRKRTAEDQPLLFAVTVRAPGLCQDPSLRSG